MSLLGFEQVIGSYYNVINGYDFVFNTVHGTFTHIHHNILVDAKYKTVKAYSTLAKNAAKVKLLNNVDDNNRALDYNYEKYDIKELVILINILLNRIDNYNLCNKMGIKIGLEYDYWPFSHHKLEELQCLTVNAIESFTKESMKRI